MLNDVVNAKYVVGKNDVLKGAKCGKEKEEETSCARSCASECLLAASLFFYIEALKLNSSF